MIKNKLKLISVIIVFCGYLPAQVKTGKIKTVDKILAIIYSPQDPANPIASSLKGLPILQSDLNQEMFGASRTLDEVIFEKRVEIDGTNLKIIISDSEVDRHIAYTQKANKLTQEDTIETFKKMGLTFDQGREFLKTSLLRDRVIEHRVRTKSFVTKKEIEENFKANPIYIEASYKICQAYIPFNDESPALTKIKLERAIESNEINDLVSWETEIELLEDQISQDKAFIKDLNINDISIASTSEDGITLIKLISKKPKVLIPLKERETEIRQKLMQEKMAKTFKEYQESLLKPESGITVKKLS